MDVDAIRTSIDQGSVSARPAFNAPQKFHSTFINVDWTHTFGSRWLNEAGATLGATPIYRFRRVVLPLSLPGVVTGVVFVFSLSIAMYVIPSLLIGDRFQTLATLIGRSFLFMRNEQLGATTATVLLVLAVGTVVGSGVLARRLGRSA